MIMAINYVQPGNSIKLPVTSGAKSGAWEMIGDLAVVLNGDADNNDNAQCNLIGVYSLEVIGADNAGDADIFAGDKVYVDGAVLNADDTDGLHFGHALDTVNAGETKEIRVRLKQG
jgi:predicted RecA/RadA family phage recombinase